MASSGSPPFLTRFAALPCSSLSRLEGKSPFCEPEPPWCVRPAAPLLELALSEELDATDTTEDLRLKLFEIQSSDFLLLSVGGPPAETPALGMLSEGLGGIIAFGGGTLPAPALALYQQRLASFAATLPCTLVSKLAAFPVLAARLSVYCRRRAQERQLR